MKGIESGELSAPRCPLVLIKTPGNGCLERTASSSNLVSISFVLTPSNYLAFSLSLRLYSLYHRTSVSFLTLVPVTQEIPISISHHSPRRQRSWERSVGGMC